MESKLRTIAKYTVLALLLIQVSYVVSGVIRNNLATGDAYSIWFFKAKVLTLHGIEGVADLIGSSTYHYSHSEYPVLLPVVFSVIVKIMPNISESFHELMWMYPVLYIALLCAVYKFVKTKSSSMYALLAAFVVSSSPIIERLSGISEVGFADLPLSLFLLVSLYYLVKSPMKTSWKEIVILGIVANLKLEGLIWLVAYILVKKPRDTKFYVFTPLFSLPWYIFIKVLGANSIYSYDASVLQIQSLPIRSVKLLEYLITQLVNYRVYGFLLIAIPLVIFGVFDKLSRPSRKIVKTGVIYLGAITLSYLVTPLEMIGHLDSSYYRIIAQVLPVFVSVMFIGLSEYRKKTIR